MKVIKNILFYAVSITALFFTMISFSIYDATALETVLLWGISGALWLIAVFGFTNQFVEFLNKKADILKDDNEYEVYEETENHYTSSEDFEKCYHIALNARADRIIAECCNNGKRG